MLSKKRPVYGHVGTEPRTKERYSPPILLSVLLALAAAFAVYLDLVGLNADGKEDGGVLFAGGGTRVDVSDGVRCVAGDTLTCDRLKVGDEVTFEGGGEDGAFVLKGDKVATFERRLGENIECDSLKVDEGVAGIATCNVDCELAVGEDGGLLTFEEGGKITSQPLGGDEVSIGGAPPNAAHEFNGVKLVPSLVFNVQDLRRPDDGLLQISKGGTVTRVGKKTAGFLKMSRGGNVGWAAMPTLFDLGPGGKAGDLVVSSAEGKPEFRSMEDEDDDAPRHLVVGGAGVEIRPSGVTRYFLALDNGGSVVKRASPLADLFDAPRSPHYCVVSVVGGRVDTALLRLPRAPAGAPKYARGREWVGPILLRGDSTVDAGGFNVANVKDGEDPSDAVSLGYLERHHCAGDARNGRFLNVGDPTDGGDGVPLGYAKRAAPIILAGDGSFNVNGVRRVATPVADSDAAPLSYLHRKLEDRFEALFYHEPGSAEEWMVSTVDSKYWRLPFDCEMASIFFLSGTEDACKAVLHVNDAPIKTVIVKRKGYMHRRIPDLEVGRLSEGDAISVRLTPDTYKNVFHEITLSFIKG